MPTTNSCTLHASTVALDGQALVIEGPSGSGKSALALELMARGAELVADDATEVVLRNGQLWAQAPASLPAAIEARGIGLLKARLAPPTPIALFIDLGVSSGKRLPEIQHRHLLGHQVILLHKADGAHVPSALVQYIRGGGFLIP